MVATATNLQQLVQKGWVWQGQQTPLQKTSTDFLDSGWPELNAQLGGGWLRGSVNEIQIEVGFRGELGLVLPLLQRSNERPHVWVNPPAQPYAPGLQSQGLVPQQQWCIQEADHTKALWAIEQCIQSQSVGLILAWLPQLNAAQVRRLQQVTEQAQQLVFIFTDCQQEPEARAYVNRLRLHWQDELQIEVLKRRFGWPLPPFPCALQRLLPERRLVKKSAHNNTSHAVTGTTRLTL
ncbi:hypothetical protein CWE22_08840 [Pseudidiomarina aestuarii]|uniref:Translesion DNA synthesis-associated protein ImuA n=1 Tax=Pseudidiomarina aestuarii TaxID=624146 RepID=A0A7Z7EUJ4_9GAMM|nr:translesion DNA synthesis-associated protein ImuA [Pseudidiomarina aestuarii]RUO42233.1 hypothetical protein CWE22_08840 [Pseudidiomarina aestuarii]